MQSIHGTLPLVIRRGLMLATHSAVVLVTHGVVVLVTHGVVVLVTHGVVAACDRLLRVVWVYAWACLASPLRAGEG